MDVSSDGSSVKKSWQFFVPNDERSVPSKNVFCPHKFRARLFITLGTFSRFMIRPCYTRQPRRFKIVHDENTPDLYIVPSDRERETWRGRKKKRKIFVEIASAK